MSQAHPKIILIDCDSSSLSALQAQGLNVRAGTYGPHYISDNRTPHFYLCDDLPNFAEQEIVVVDLGSKRPTWTNDQIRAHGVGLKSKPLSITVDTAPKAMKRQQELANRILRNGGVFVVFSAPLTEVSYVHDGHQLKDDNWEFLNWRIQELSRNTFSIANDAGDEITVVDHEPIGRLLNKHIGGATFGAVFAVPPVIYNNAYKPLALSKYKRTVSAQMWNADKGMVVIVPQLQDKAAFLTELIVKVLPELCPHLYDTLDGAAWLHTKPYELDTVVDLKDQVSVILEKAKAETTLIEEKIEVARAEYGHLHEILVETGAPLVAAVKKTLETIGFKNVVDVDAAHEDGNGDLNEDLQVDDQGLLLIEVKGIAGTPSDEVAMQASKYVAPRMRELKRLDIQALSIINHERHKPALERQNESPFRDVIIQNAISQEFGLMTAWDLHRLARGVLQNGWKPEVVKPLFHQHGRIEPIPTHYRLIGRVERFIEKLSVTGIRTMEVGFKKGDTIAFELPSQFVQQSVSSIQVANDALDEAPPNTLIGVETMLTKNEAREGVRVFLVSPQS